jgi:phosphoribosylformylglycinamidine (FGAM) synthase PurS component
MDNLTPISEIKAIIEQDKAKPIDFASVQNSPIVEPKKGVSDTAGELIESAFNQAIGYQVQTNKQVQDNLLNTAEKVVGNKVSSIQSKAEQEDKESYFNNNKDAVACWGYSEKTVNKKFVKIMAFIFDIFTAIWITIGTFTFAPITYVAQKIKNIAKKTWVAFLLAILIYLAIVGVPILTGILVNKK